MKAGFSARSPGIERVTLGSVFKEGTRPVEVLQSPLTPLLYSQAGHPEWLSFAHQLPRRVVKSHRASSGERQRPRLVQHHRHTVPFPTDGRRHVRHQLEIGDRRGTVEVLLGIADQHNRR